MVRMFKPQFAPLVEAGTKRQTVRPMPKRMPKPGDPISLRAWVGAPYRSKQRVLRYAIVTEVQEILIAEDGIMLLGAIYDWVPGEHAFAKADGFDSWISMREWFRKTHGLPFCGILIRWK